MGSVALMGLPDDTYVVQCLLRGPSVMCLTVVTLAALVATYACILRSVPATHRCSVHTTLYCAEETLISADVYQH